MRLHVIASLFFASLAVVDGAATYAKDECGDLGVMNIDVARLTSGIDPSKVRKCLNHPEGSDGPNDSDVPSVNVSSLENKALERRECWFKSRYGCSTNGYCWKVCDGNGGWCWAASNGGTGDWLRCASYKDCGEGDSFACGAGGCKDCGCSCH
ncbi:hypothetical protein HGRIS_011210 [Hohenbuehelia grisea]|uniref:Uncharacterized protein n=1 Tax=Hohenbuehelia grisea TaxID=104357 RepID=A0ABR3JWC9_9AGAR